jgi:hypothetical protein
MWIISSISRDDKFSNERRKIGVLEDQIKKSNARPKQPGSLGTYHNLQSGLNNDPLPNEVILNKGEELFDTGLYYPNFDYYFEPLILSRIDIRRWILAAPFLKEGGFRNVMHDNVIEFHGRSSNWKLPSNLTAASKILAWAVLISSSVLYGGLHMFAWDAPFRTEVEQILWRISAPTLMSYGFLFVGQITFVKWNEDILNIYLSNCIKDNFWVSVKRLTLLVMELVVDRGKAFAHLGVRALVVIYILCYYFLLAFTLCASLLYLLARVFLVVECFLSLFHSPPA